MNAFENGMKQLLVGHLSELHFCENQLLHALESMAKAAQDPRLKNIFLNHKKETQVHVERLQEAFRTMHAEPKVYPCRAIQGLLEDGIWTMRRLQDDPMLDHALIALAMKVEMFEIASYRSAIRQASHIGLAKVAELCASNMEEEEAAEEELSELLPRSVAQV